MADPTSPWLPLSPVEVGALLVNYPRRWCIAGGWALDLFLGRQTREHADTDVLVFRDDLRHLHPVLGGWELFGANSGELTPWVAGKELEPGTHDVWCRRDGGAWAFQFMVIESTPTEWIYRRDTRLLGPVEDLMLNTADGLPILAPEIQLLYKSKHPRSKDEADFAMVLPALDNQRRTWLAKALVLTDPANPWLARLADDHP